jgi:hypothetical protein
MSPEALVAAAVYAKSGLPSTSEIFFFGIPFEPPLAVIIASTFNMLYDLFYTEVIAKRLTSWLVNCPDVDGLANFKEFQASLP